VYPAAAAGSTLTPPGRVVTRSELDKFIDACLIGGIVLVPDPDTGCAWITDPGAIEPAWAEAIARDGFTIGAHLRDEPRTIGSVLHRC